MQTDTDTKTDVQMIREAFDALHRAISDEDGIIEVEFPEAARDAWDDLLDAIEKAEERK